MTIQQQVGIPSQYQDSWDLAFDPQRHPIAYAIALEGCERITDPLTDIDNGLRRALREMFTERFTEEERERADKIIELLDHMTLHRMEIAILICAMLLPRLTHMGGTPEESLQSACAASGLRSPDDADEFLRARFRDNSLPKMIRKVLPDFNSEKLTIIKANRH